MPTIHDVAKRTGVAPITVFRVVDKNGYVSEEKRSRGNQALRTNPRPTAIFATNNFIAIGTMLALREAGIPVPEQMSVVAFDDLPAAITFDPLLTVAAQPAYEIGQQATELLLSPWLEMAQRLIRKLCCRSRSSYADRAGSVQKYTRKISGAGFRA